MPPHQTICPVLFWHFTCNIHLWTLWSRSKLCVSCRNTLHDHTQCLLWSYYCDVHPVYPLCSACWVSFYIHSSKILTIQQGQPQGVSSVGNPRQASMGHNSGSLMAEVPTTVWIYLINISHKVCRALTKCWCSMVHLVVLSEFSKSVGTLVWHIFGG